MGNILPEVKASELTYALPTKIPEYSSEAVKTRVPGLHVQTDKVLKKDDLYLYIGSEKISIVNKNIREVCIDLLERGVNVSCIEYESILDLPAILLNDILTVEHHQTNVTTNPVNLECLNNTKLRSLIPIKSEVKALYCGNTLTKEKAVSLQRNDRLFIKGNIDSNFILYYAVEVTEFIWYLDYNHIVTRSKEFVGKNMEGIA